jgi:anti-sigma factor RsiW
VWRPLLIDPHDMSCQELVALLTEYLDGTLSAHDRARLDAHLEVCDDCRQYLDQFQATIQLLRAS